MPLRAKSESPRHAIGEVITATETQVAVPAAPRS